MGVDQIFRASPEEEVPEPHIDVGKVVDGYVVERMLSSDPWRRRAYEAAGPDGRRVELKVVALRSSDGRQLRRRFFKRVRDRAAVEHPHLLPILGAGRFGDDLYLVMGLSRAPTLADLLEAGPLKKSGALRLLGQIADALEEAHSRGVLHRDLAPGTVIVEPHAGGHALLGDFGVGKPDLRSGLSALVEASDYLSPEEIRDEPLGPQSNVYTLACILVECLTGTPPFTSDLPDRVAYAHVAEPPPRLTDRRPELPSEIDDVIALAMAKEPEDRISSPLRLVRAASAALGVPVPMPSRSPDGSRRSPGPSAGAALPAFEEPSDASGRDAGPPARRPLAGLGAWMRDAGSGVSRRLASVPEAAPRLRLPRVTAPSLPRLEPRAVGRDALVAMLVAGTVVAGVVGFAVGRSDTTPAAPDRQSATDNLRAEQTRYLRETRAVVERLNARRAVERRRLAAAERPQAQARASARLARGYRAAREALPPAVPGIDGAAVPSALRGAERAYRRLGDAARGENRADYAAARGAVRRSEARLDRALLRLDVNR